MEEMVAYLGVHAEEEPIRRDFGADAPRVIAMVRAADKEQRERMLAKERAAKVAREREKERDEDGPPA